MICTLNHSNAVHRLYRIALLLLFYHPAINHAESAYQWRCSAHNDQGHVYVPNVHLERSPNLRITDSKVDVLYVYRIPAALNCSGTVVGIEFCYNSDGMEQIREIFALLPLMEVGVQFNVTSSVLHFEGDPTKDSCSDRSVCCNRLNVSTHIQLSGDEFVFGVSIPRGGTTWLPFMSQYVIA